MKIVLFVSLLLSLTIHRVLFFLSISLSVSHNQSHIVYSKLIITITKSTHLGIFFALNAIIITILLGNSKPPIGDSDQLFLSLPSSEYQAEHEEENARNDENHYYIDDGSIFPLLRHLEYDKQEERTEEDEEKAIVKSYNDEEDDEFVPRLVYIEYRKDIVKYHDHDDKGDVQGNCGYADYEDKENGGNDLDIVKVEEENGDDDLARRIEEFLAKVHNKWREELIEDKKLLIAYA